MTGVDLMAADERPGKIQASAYFLKGKQHFGKE
jgi:hypothetical protein